MLVGAITIAGVLVRLPSLGNALFGDELSTYSIVTGHTLGHVLHTLYGHSVDLNPPLSFVLAWLTEKLGDSPTVLRLTSLLAGTAAIPLTYLLGVRTVGRRAALAGAALIALSPFLIFYSAEARAYALVMALVLGSTLALLNAAEGNRRSWWAAYAMFSSAAIYAHYTAVFVLTTQLVWAFFRYPNRRRALIGANVIALLLFIPWVPAFVRATHSFGAQVFAIQEPFNLGAVGHDVAHWSIGHPYLTLESIPGTIAIAMILTGVGVATVGAIVRSRSITDAAPLASAASTSLLPVLLAVAAPIGLVAYSALIKDTWDMRNLITSWPGLALVIGMLLTTVDPPLRVLCVGLAIGGFAIGAVRLLSPERQRPDYTAAARFVIREGAPTDPIAIVPAPTPGPLAAVDAALAYLGQPGRPLLRVGSAPLQAVLRSPPYALLPATPPAVLVRQALQAGGDGKLFVIAPGTAAVATLLGSGHVDASVALGPVFGTGTTGRLFETVFGPLSSFLRAASERYRPIQTRTFPGVLRLSVYVLQRR